LPDLDSVSGFQQAFVVVIACAEMIDKIFRRPDREWQRGLISGGSGI
jgi:hypothetical protein